MKKQKSIAWRIRASRVKDLEKERLSWNTRALFHLLKSTNKTYDILGLLSDQINESHSKICMKLK